MRTQKRKYLTASSLRVKYLRTTFPVAEVPPWADGASIDLFIFSSIRLVINPIARRIFDVVGDHLLASHCKWETNNKNQLKVLR